MATRSTISAYGKKIYCHNLGSLFGVGETLKKHYKSKKKIEALMALGNISFLGKKVAPEEGQIHNFERNVKDVTVAYHRDRGDDLIWCNPNQMEEYNYVWDEKNKQWDCILE